MRVISEAFLLGKNEDGGERSESVFEEAEFESKIPIVTG